MSFPTDNGVTYTTKTNNVDIINDSDVNNLQTEVTALKTKVGVNSSADTSSHDYKLGEILTTDKAVGKTATQTLTNKTLTAPTVTGATITTSTVNGVTITTAGSATDFLAANGSYSSPSQLLPPGMVAPYSGSSAPTGWLLADGTAVSRTTYAALFAITSTTYGSGDGSTTFNLPDLKGRVAVGKSADTEFDVLGETGGAKTHTLSESELPAHTHSMFAAGGTSVGGSGTSSGGGAGGAVTTGSTGSGTAHNNLQPYITLNYIIKT